MKADGAVGVGLERAEAPGIADWARGLFDLCGEVESLAEEKGTATAGILLRAFGEVCTRMGAWMKPPEDSFGDPQLGTRAEALRKGMVAPATAVPARKSARRGKKTRGATAGRAAGVRKDSVLCPSCGEPGKKKGHKRAEGPYRECGAGHVFNLDGSARALSAVGTADVAPPKKARALRAEATSGAVAAVATVEDRIVVAIGDIGRRVETEELLKALDRTNYPGQALENLKESKLITVDGDGQGSVWHRLTEAGRERYAALKKE